MESVIAGMLEDFEDGKLNRRQLIQSIAIAAAAVAMPGRVGAAPREASFNTIGIDHISYSVVDYEKTRDFYADLMGMRIEEYADGSAQCRMFFGDEGAHMIARSRPVPAGHPADQPTGRVDHISFQIADWDTDRVEAELNRRGLAPRLDTGTPGRRPWASFHVRDPDGTDLQISGDLKPGDRLYK
jgi:catechol 2,3-dioxygenase-like lactoylglutathione lyase family enzyme